MGANGDAGNLIIGSAPDSRGVWYVDVPAQGVCVDEVTMPRQVKIVGTFDNLPAEFAARGFKLLDGVINRHHHAGSHCDTTGPPPDVSDSIGAILTLAPTAPADAIAMGSDRFAPSAQPGRMS